jgi:DNA-binding transcriptional MerR regulator
MLTIGGLASRAGLTTDSLRYYERLGLIEPVSRTRGNYRLYDATAVERLEFIRKAQVLGLTLEEVGDVLRASRAGTPPCEHVRSTLARRLGEVDARMADLRALRRTLVAALERSQALPVANSCVCDIIASQELPAPRAPGRHARRSLAGRIRREEAS